MKQLFLLSIIFFFGCKSEPDPAETAPEVPTPTYTVSAEDIENLDYTDYVLSSKSHQAILDWQKYQDLEVQMDLLKKANLSFFKVEKKIMEEFIKELKAEQPKILDTPAIRARITVLETSLMRLQDVSNLDNIKEEELLEVIKGVLVADANLKLQINKKLEKESQQIQFPTN